VKPQEKSHEWIKWVLLGAAIGVGVTACIILAAPAGVAAAGTAIVAETSIAATTTAVGATVAAEAGIAVATATVAAEAGIAVATATVAAETGIAAAATATAAFLTTEVGVGTALGASAVAGGAAGGGLYSIKQMAKSTFSTIKGWFTK
jgi:hypothetical protein